jgi:hypothetical protein
LTTARDFSFNNVSDGLDLSVTGGKEIELIGSDGLLDELQDVLSRNPGIEQLLVSRRTLHNALTSFVDGKVDAAELVEWANRVEQHNDEIAYERAFQQLIATLIFRLSTREINRPIDRHLCREMLVELAAG